MLMLRFRSTMALGAAGAAIGLLGTWGCAEPTNQEDDDLEVIAAAQVVPPVPDPNGISFASVTANGTGCPRGTFSTRIAQDGLTFTTTFSAYKVAVEPDIDFDVRDCQLAIKLHSSQNRSYSIQTFTYRGFARLSTGVTGRQSANYYFQGASIEPAKEKRTDLVGPYEGAFEFEDQVAARDRVWSPCGVDRDLNVRTRVELRNGSPRGSGVMSLNEIDGAARVEFKVVTRPCDAVRAGSGFPGITPPVSGILPTSDPPGTTPAATNATVPGEPTRITVTPGVIRRDQSFSVSWVNAPGDPVGTRYRVRLTRFGDSFESLVWESGESTGAAIEIPPNTLSAFGEYDVVVVARAGMHAVFSAPALVRVIAGK
jgi:hypothetical protein